MIHRRETTIKRNGHGYVQKKTNGRQPPTLWVARPGHLYSPHCYILGIYK